MCKWYLPTSNQCGNADECPELQTVSDCPVIEYARDLENLHKDPTYKATYYELKWVEGKQPIPYIMPKGV